MMPCLVLGRSRKLPDRELRKKPIVVEGYALLMRPQSYSTKQIQALLAHITSLSGTIP